MTALEQYSAPQVAILKLFAYAFHAAPTKDLVALGVSSLIAGSSEGSILDFLFNVEVLGSPFAKYKNGSSDADFVSALVENFTYGTSIGADTKAAWKLLLLPDVHQHGSRGDFTLFVSDAVEAYVGADPELATLHDALAARLELAAAFAKSTAGALYDAMGWGQLTAPMVSPPTTPEPTYALSVSAETFDEGQTATFTLRTTDVAAGTVIDYTLDGNGITAADLVGGQLTGRFTIGADGTATVALKASSDGITEGPESLLLALAGGLADARVAITDTSLTPPAPTYLLRVDATSRNEGGSLTFTLSTSLLPTGTVVPYTLSGTGITAADIVGRQLSGSFTTDAAGVARVTIGLSADATTEGNETLRMTLGTGLAAATAVIEDFSLTPEPGGPDTLIIADALNNSQSHVPANAAEGEIGVETYLSYDLLRQVADTAVRMSLADLRDTGVPGAPPIPTNRSADRGDIPQVSNQHQFTFDLGGGTDRVDYSAEQGRIVLVVGDKSPAGTRFVLINDNAIDSGYNDAFDRIDTLTNAEEYVASAGGGVLDLTTSGQDWLITFSAGTDFNPSLDRELRRIDLAVAGTGASTGLSLLDSRDAGINDAITLNNAVWVDVQGSDHDETLIFSDAESLDQRYNPLRGGDNEVSFGSLTKSVLSEASISRWLPISDPADASNLSAQSVVTTTFSSGDGVSLLSSASNVVRSYTPDNRIAAGTLTLSASSDHEDSLRFVDGQPALQLTLGDIAGGVDVVTVGLAETATDIAVQGALVLSRYETLLDNAGADDVYVMDNISRALLAGPSLVDSATADHDTVRLNNSAVGSGPVGGLPTLIKLASINGASVGFNFDFDVLDISPITQTELTINGTTGSDDELVLGRLASVSSTTLFEALVLTPASFDKGTAFTLDLDSAALKAGSNKVFNTDSSVLSGNGLVYSSPGLTSSAAPVETGFKVTVIDSDGGSGATVWGGDGNDTLTGDSGDDVFRGAAGNDTLDGGISAESWQFELSGGPDFSVPANRIAITLSVDGTALTLTEAAVADTSYADGNGAFVDGAGRSVIGKALAALVNANLDDINQGPGSGTLVEATWDTAGSILTLRFELGVDTDDVVTLSVAPNGDTGTFIVSSGNNLVGGSSGDDLFVFEASGALNGTDTLLNFVGGSDHLDVTAFTGVDVTGGRPKLDGDVGGVFGGLASKAELIYNKTGGLLTTGDFTTGTVSAKFSMPDDTRSIVAVTADPTGISGDASNTPVRVYYVVNGPGIGLSDLSVSLVGVISGPDELSLDDIVAALG